MKFTLFSLIIAIVLLFAITPALQAEGDDCPDETCAENPQEYGLSDEIIMSYIEPNFVTNEMDTSLLYDRRYMRVNEAVDVHDAPNGNYIRTLAAGFNFVTAFNEQDGWIRIGLGSPEEWVRLDKLVDTNYKVSHFTGIFLAEETLEYTVAWVLVEGYPANEPGGEPLEENGFLERYTRITIFDTVEIDGWNWYQIGVGKWIHQTDIAKMVPVERPEEVTTDKWISVDLYEQVLIVHQDDKPIFVTLISSGLLRWPTFEGIFNIFFRTTRRQMSWGTPGDDFYYLEEVPWTLFFDDGRALHGTYWHDGFGYRRSHGCVNLSITDAHWLYYWVAEDFDTLRSPGVDVETGPAVYVYSSGVYR
jgi:hypothetical protein